MSTNRIATALGAAVLLLGVPTSYALAGEVGPGRPDNAGGVHECEDGVDNDDDGTTDFGGDADCGSARDNSERPDDDAEEPGGEPAPGLPPELQAVIDEVLAQVFPAEEPGEEEPPAEEPPAEEPPTEEPPVTPPTQEELEAAVQEVLDSLPSGGEPPLTPPTPEELQAALQELVDSLPPPPAG